MARIDLNLLQLFLQVANSQGFSAAAKELGVQRSSVSRGVATLEQDLGVQLFHRTTRCVSLTSAGEALYTKTARQISSLSDALEDLPEREDDAAGQLRITVPHDLGATVFAAATAGFARRYPRVQLDVRVTNRVVDLVSEGFDAALRPGASQLPDSSLRARRLASCTAGLFASPTYLAQAGTPRTLDEARKHAWVLGPTGSRPNVKLERSAVVIADDMLFVRSALVEHLGLGFLPDFLVGPDIVSGRLVRLALDQPELELFIYLLTPPAEHVPRKVRVLRDYLVEYFRIHPLADSRQ